LDRDSREIQLKAEMATLAAAAVFGSLYQHIPPHHSALTMLELPTKPTSMIVHPSLARSSSCEIFIHVDSDIRIQYNDAV
jgi:hypothetical protein